MGYSTSIGVRGYRFADLRELMAKASPERSGDGLAGIAATSAEERWAARHVLAGLPLQRFVEEWLIEPDRDEVSALIAQQFDALAMAPVIGLSVGEFRDWLLSDAADAASLSALAPVLMPEMVAAVSKLMRNQDLVLVARKRRVVSRFRSTLGQAGVMAVRLQPNHPTDDARGIAASILDGLLLGCGDACIGINPAGDDPAGLARLWRLLDELITRHEIPTQSCVLAHLTRQIQAIEAGLPVDLVFQSIGGTAALNRSFGIDLALLREAHDAVRATGRGGEHAQRMYFETGQGSALSADAHHGVDQQTCEARAYAVARAFDPLLVNSVVGFIGPEYLYDGRQIIRAALEDHFCGKLLGLPMGVDVCYTTHAEADQDDMDILLTVIGAAGVNYIMGVPGADDVMLNYQSTSFHDALYLRRVLGLRPAPEFAAWLQAMGIADAGGLPLPDAPNAALTDLRALVDHAAPGAVCAARPDAAAGRGT